MSIASCFDAIKSGLDAVMTGYGDEGAVRHELGEEHLDLLEEYVGQVQPKPSIIWVPMGSTDAYTSGSMRDATSTKTPRGLRAPAQIASRHEAIDAFVWAPNLRACEKLINHFVATARLQLTAHSFQVRSTRWSVGVDRKPKRGALCILRFTLHVPFTTEPEQVARAPFTPTVTGAFVEEIPSS
jgi:hypothetical protein